jgi:hypothetical protein
MATNKKWSAKVDTDSTHPDQGLFTRGPNAIAKALASKKVSPKGPASGMRMLNFYINRAGKNLPETRKEALQKAKTILSGIITEHKETPTPAKKTEAKKSAAKRSGTKKTGAKKATAKKVTRSTMKKSTRTTHPKKRAAKKAA